MARRHHPDFQGQRSTHELIERLHREHLAHVAALRDRLEEIHGHPEAGLVARRADMTTTFGQATVEMSATRRIRATMTMAAARPATQPLLILGELRHG
jgi:hypothetical protein